MSNHQMIERVTWIVALILIAGHRCEIIESQDDSQQITTINDNELQTSNNDQNSLDNRVKRKIPLDEINDVLHQVYHFEQNQREEDRQIFEQLCAERLESVSSSLGAFLEFTRLMRRVLADDDALPLGPGSLVCANEAVATSSLGEVIAYNGNVCDRKHVERLLDWQRAYVNNRQSDPLMAETIFVGYTYQVGRLCSMALPGSLRLAKRQLDKHDFDRVLPWQFEPLSTSPDEPSNYEMRHVLGAMSHVPTLSQLSIFTTRSKISNVNNANGEQVWYVATADATRAQVLQSIGNTCRRVFAQYYDNTIVPVALLEAANFVDSSTKVSDGRWLAISQVCGAMQNVEVIHSPNSNVQISFGLGVQKPPTRDPLPIQADADQQQPIAHVRVPDLLPMMQRRSNKWLSPKSRLDVRCQQRSLEHRFVSALYPAASSCLIKCPEFMLRRMPPSWASTAPLLPIWLIDSIVGRPNIVNLRRLFTRLAVRLAPTNLNDEEDDLALHENSLIKQMHGISDLARASRRVIALAGDKNRANVLFVLLMLVTDDDTWATLKERLDELGPSPTIIEQFDVWKNANTGE